MKKYNLPYINQQVETVILANGEFPTHPIASSILNNCSYLVCCDGAINSLSQTNRQPDAIVGDCDSLSGENQKRFVNIIHRITEQETNDLTKAVQFCLKQGRNKITILGATGKREDHTVGNISLLCEYMHDAAIEMISNYGVFIGIKEPAVFESFSKQQVSIFSMERSIITSRNLAYRINKQKYTKWWQATLNESIDTEFTVETDGQTIVYRVFD